MKKPFSLSICVPALNEEKSLRQAVEDLLKTLLSSVQTLEIIIVDDGSSDSTPQLADQISKEHPRIKVIHHKRNLGIGACYRDALAVAGGDYYTWFPADHENSAEEFVQCLPYLKKDTLVTCYHSADPRSVLRRWISRSYTWLVNKYFGLNLKYYNGLTTFPRSILCSFPLRADGFVFTAESLIYAVQHGCQIVELAAPLRDRASGKSKALTFTSIYHTLRDLLHIFKLKKRIKIEVRR